jgi:UDP-N-acetylmuramoyl-tripeptide--D-alanyl-D-alanine ligase
MSMASLGSLAAMGDASCDGSVAAHVVEGIGTDTREDLSGQLFVAIRGPRFDGHEHLEAAKQAGAAAALVETGTRGPVGLPLVHVADTRRSLMSMAGAWRQSLPLLRVIAITGTAGKTSTKDTLAGICRAVLPTVASPRSFNNDIGVPLSILATRESDRVLVAEVGTSAPGEIASLAKILQPDVAVVTLVGRGHLAGFGSLEAVAREKYDLLRVLSANGRGFVRHQQLDVPSVQGEVQTFGPEAVADHVIADRGPGWMEVAGHRWRVGLAGPSGAANSLAAMLAARAVGIDDSAIAIGLEAAAPSPHRLQIREIGGLTVIDDTWNANPESMASTLETVEELVPPAGRLVLVLGDMLELGSESEVLHRGLSVLLDRLASRAPLAAVVLVGPEMAFAAEAVGTGWSGVSVVHEPQSDAACMERIVSRLSPGDTVLLKASRGMALERVAILLEAEAKSR